MRRGKTIKRETTHNGTLNKLITFYRTTVSEEFYETDKVTKKKYKAWGEVSEMSFQDLENLKGRFTKNALALESIKSKAVKSFVTVKIRDSLGEYLPTNSDMVKIQDQRYEELEWEVLEVKPDLRDSRYLIISLGGV